MTVYKNSSPQFTDSEIDSIIDLRKLLAALTGKNIDKETLPSTINVVQMQS